MTNDNLAQHLRSWGLKVQEKEGWRGRGRPYSFRPQGIICHHTASPANGGNFNSENVVSYGRPGLPGPLCQLLLGRDGTVKVIAGGYANHAGYGGPRAGIPKDQGNTYTWGIEAENNGIGERWPAVQLNAYYRLCAALMAYSDIDDVRKVFAHKEWTSRKIDPAGINMDGFRNQVQNARRAGSSIIRIRLSSTGPGHTTPGIRRVKVRLKKRGFFNAPVGRKWTKATTEAYKKYQESLGYTGKDANGIPGKTSLEGLGFRVVP